ncbi:MAG: hypothetical protein NPIRA02_35790 [Nitrospirales bacterium]|nr:MAG: hypothetical protein NPIRA02_35790 [Nitrospirales bacterium]
MPTETLKLVRKQYLVSPKNVIKLDRIAKKKGTSATAIVREAIDAYDPEGLDAVGDTELMGLVSTKLKEAIHDTQTMRKKLSKTFKSLGIE